MVTLKEGPYCTIKCVLLCLLLINFTFQLSVPKQVNFTGVSRSISVSQEIFRNIASIQATTTSLHIFRA